jgi:DNA-binding beta-propeller fold protein YncE
MLRNTLRLLATLVMAAEALTAAADTGTNTASPATTYAITHRVPAPDALWDHVSIDRVANKLYVGHVGGVMAVDLTSLAVTPSLFSTPYSHGAAPITGTALAASSNGPSKSVSIFETSTGRTIATIVTHKDTDALIYEPETGLLITGDKEAGTLTLIDVRKRAVAGTIVVGGNPEFLAADGKGLVYANVVDKNEIAVFDVPARKRIRTIKLAQCEEPSGLAYDATDRLLMAVCSNGIAKFVNAATGADTATVAIGKGADAAIFDEVRRIAFAPNGDDGTLTVISVRGAADIVVTQTLRTEVSARTGALDPRTGRVYLPSAKMVPPAKPGGYPSVARGSSYILVVEPRP